jgi:hypothetical protein
MSGLLGLSGSGKVEADVVFAGYGIRPKNMATMTTRESMLKANRARFPLRTSAKKREEPVPNPPAIQIMPRYGLKQTMRATMARLG